jgi:hypothetical protein
VADDKHLSNKKEYWQDVLKALCIEPRRQDELNDKEELQALAKIIKKKSITNITRTIQP